LMYIQHVAYPGELLRFFCSPFFPFSVLRQRLITLLDASCRNNENEKKYAQLSVDSYLVQLFFAEFPKEKIMTSEVIDELKEKMESSVDAYKRELTRIRTGRASLALLDGIKVDAYGSMLPMDQVGTLTIPESSMIAIKPWDPQMIAPIEKAILSSDLGLTPANDGNVIRLTIPPLTEERRKELVKQVKKVGEEFKVAIRNVRRDANDTLKAQKKDKEISEDDMFRLQDEAQKATDSFIKQIDDIAASKEVEVMEV